MSAGKYYILDGKTPKVASLEEWAQWFEFDGSRRVARDVIGDVMVSTVFLGIDHSFYHGALKLFETMIFGGVHDEHQSRSSTWEEAEKQHAEAVAMVRSGLS